MRRILALPHGTFTTFTIKISRITTEIMKRTILIAVLLSLSFEIYAVPKIIRTTEVAPIRKAGRRERFRFNIGRIVAMEVELNTKKTPRII